MNRSKKIMNIVFYIVIPIFCIFLTHWLSNGSFQESIVESLSSYFDVVDENMSYEQAIQAIREESEKLKNENEDFKEKMSDIPNIELKSTDIIINGLKTQENVNKAVAVIDGNNYYSESIINQVLDNKFIYDVGENTLFYNTSGENIVSETKIELLDTNVLYDGTCYEKILPSDGKDFSIGSKSYNKGFIIYDDHTLFGDGDGYALFDLQGEYSKIAFDVGRTNEYEKQDVTLKVYLDNKYVEEYSLNAESPAVYIEINLNYANHMKLQITGGSRVKYGFANAILYY